MVKRDIFQKPDANAQWLSETSCLCHDFTCGLVEDGNGARWGKVSKFVPAMSSLWNGNPYETKQDMKGHLYGVINPYETKQDMKGQLGWMSYLGR